MQAVESTGTTKHVWDGQNILLETNGSNSIEVVYTLQPLLYGNLISQRRSTTTSFYLFDGLGSTTQLVNSSGTVADSYVYDSFGNILLTSGSTVNPFRYVGRLGYYVGVDLPQCYLRARYYTPGGRFLSRDPLGISLRAINYYSYVKNNPLSFIDPSGMAPTVTGCLSNAATACLVPLTALELLLLLTCIPCVGAVPPVGPVPCFIACAEAIGAKIGIGEAVCMLSCFVVCYFYCGPCPAVGGAGMEQ